MFYGWNTTDLVFFLGAGLPLMIALWAIVIAGIVSGIKEFLSE